MLDMLSTAPWPKIFSKRHERSVAQETEGGEGDEEMREERVKEKEEKRANGGGAVVVLIEGERCV